MLQIMKSDEFDGVSYNRHISNLNTIYKLLVPDASQSELVWFEKLARKLYIKFGIIPKDERQNITIVTDLSANQYPILADLLDVIKEEKSLHNSDDEAFTYIYKIELIIENLITNYGYIFNGHTSIEDILSNQIVFFDIKNLSNLKPEIFDAQLISSLSLCWDNCIKIGQPMKKLYDEGKISLRDVRHFMVMLDESHKTINANKPSNTAIDRIKVLFDLSQYKFVLNQDPNAIETIDKVFRNSFTESELREIPRLSKGETILSIQSDRNIAFSIDCTARELELFRGGA